MKAAAAIPASYLQRLDGHLNGLTPHLDGSACNSNKKGGQQAAFFMTEIGLSTTPVHVVDTVLEAFIASRVRPDDQSGRDFGQIQTPFD